jgi:peptide/nickel transport system permease protein
MYAYLVRRILLALVVIILVTLMVFFVMRLLPGDPVMLFLASSSDMENMTPEQVQKVRHQYGLDKPLLVQYGNWLGGVLRGDLGISISMQTRVTKLIAERYPVTIHLGLLAFIISNILGIAIGLIAAIRRGKWIDTILTGLAYLGVCIPIFWLGILMIYGFGLKLGWLPIAGYTSPLDNFWLSTRQAIMPVACLSIFGLASIARQMRSSMLEVIRQDYIRTAWSKGLRERVIVLRHALKNSLIPIVTLVGMGVAHIFGGSVIVETVFAIPGMGRLMVTSLFGHDYVMVQSGVLITAFIIIFTNLVVDISYGWIDPRIRYS